MEKENNRVKYVCIVLLLVFSFQPLRAGAEDQVSSIIRGIRKTYAGLPGLEVPYQRVILTKSMVMLGGQVNSDLATGKIYFMPPCFLKVEQRTPGEEFVITDGTTLWWYIPNKKQVYKYPSEKLGKGLKVLGEIFQGLKAVEESFGVTFEGQNSQGNFLLQLKPQPPWPDIDHIALSVNPQDYTICTVGIYDPVGGLTKFTLGKLREKTLDKDFFRFTVPNGVKVIEEEG